MHIYIYIYSFVNRCEPTRKEIHRVEKEEREKKNTMDDGVLLDA